MTFSLLASRFIETTLSSAHVSVMTLEHELGLMRVLSPSVMQLSDDHRHPLAATHPAQLRNLDAGLLEPPLSEVAAVTASTVLDCLEAEQAEPLASVLAGDPTEDGRELLDADPVQAGSVSHPELRVVLDLEQPVGLQ